MNWLNGAIDADLHPMVPGIQALAPYLPPLWRDQIAQRGMEGLDTQAFPPNSPKTVRADWRPASGAPASTITQLREQVLDPWGIARGIVTPLYGVQLIFNEDMGRAFTSALNDWTRAEWLDQDPRLAGSIVLPMFNPEHAVAEIERLAPDPRFVQAMVLVMGESPLGRRQNWPIFEALVRHKLPLAIHAGSCYRNPVTSLGWPSWYAEDYAANQQAFQSTLASLITEGAFQKFPDLKVVLLESGVSWLPAFLWRLSKTWKGVRFEVPWLQRSPLEIVRDHVRLSIQPFDAPDDAETVQRLMEHLGSDEMLLWSSDWPHWQFDGAPQLPPGIGPELARKICVDNARATYSRLSQEALP
ncbi:amidohydrolase [Rhodovarius crocodyli]|uniref:Amidohydrolase n=1 Tax=Rhodovarius crocodyli TaxID=1979269 RepID=A0A437MER9_9PROT|nr:amidohydrolase family protein [Rhodovarius crocodyli]RVT96116.1 amidohydrolase [Rhodovarius crocodyli]